MRDRRRGPPTDRFGVLAGLSLAALAAGAILHAAGRPGAGDAMWAALIAVTLAPLSWAVARDVVRGRLGVDVIALLAMAGTLALGEQLAGAVIALMLSGGRALEAAADRRARRELSALLRRAPAVAHVRRGDTLIEVPVDAVGAGDTVVVRAGEVVPADGVVTTARAIVDASALTGESLPMTLERGEAVRSGVANAGAPFDVAVARPARESAYATLVRLVAAAGAQRPPFVRLADRYAAVFLPLTVLTAGGAWLASGDAVRALAVLVVATPCPLILAAPIALVSGVSRAARCGVIVKGASAIEALGRARAVLLDKTGTLTVGTPTVSRVEAAPDASTEDVLRLAASVDQLSAHVLAEAITHDATRRGLSLATADDVREEPGQGIEGRVGGRRVAVGSRDYVTARGHRWQAGDGPEALDGQASVIVGIDGRIAGVLVMTDPPRPDAERLVAQLHAAGIRHVALVSGDRRAIAEAVGRRVGVDRVYAEQSPSDKLAVVRALRGDPATAPVVMVGDGVNDAPALALADVGIAMAGEGSTVSAQTADAVITVDRIDRVADAVRIGRRSLAIARQSVVAGMALSVAAMGAAAAGLLIPVAGAVLQEAIDVAVIVNALRALR